MEIRTRALNKDEYFICSKKDVKQVFGDSLIKVRFGYFDRDYEFKKTEKVKKGKIIAWMQISQVKTLISPYDTFTRLPTLYFYVLKKDEYSEELRKEFISKFFPKIKEAYLAHKNDDTDLLCGRYTLEVELLDDKLIWHDFFGPIY